MIDIHVLTYSKTNPQWLDQCLASIQSPLCTVHVVEGVEGHIGQGRSLGYSRGTNEYVGYVDSDDYLLPDTIERVAHFLKRHKFNSITTLEQLIYRDDPTPITSMPVKHHHLFVAKRSVIEPLLPRYEQTSHFADRCAVLKLRPTSLPFVGYVWRRHPNQSHITHAFNESRLKEQQWL